MGGRRAGCAAGTVTFLLPSLSHSDRAQSPSSNAKSAPQYYCTIETEVNAIPLWPSIHRYQRKSGPYVSGMVLGRPPTAASTAVQNVQLTRLEFMRFVYTRYTRVVFVLLCVLLCIQRLLYFYLRSTDTKSATLTRARGDISSRHGHIKFGSGNHHILSTDVGLAGASAILTSSFFSSLRPVSEA